MNKIIVEKFHVAGQQQVPEEFPLAYVQRTKRVSKKSLQDWIETNRDELLTQLSLHGAILFRDFPVPTDKAFDRFITAFGLRNFAYAESLSNAVRRNRTERVFTANEAPPSVNIYLHHEMAQTPVFPSRLFFYCEKAAEYGGATPLCRSDLLLERLLNFVPEFIAECESKGVRYSNVMPGIDDPESGQGRSWRSTLSTKDKDTAEAKLQDLGYEWQWLEEDTLKVTTPVLPAIKTLKDGRRVFFNQLIAAFRGWKDKRNQGQKAICFGDGSEISNNAMAVAIQFSDELSFDMNWKAGDVALVDNMLVMHGRRAYEGERRVLASLVAMD